MIPCVNCNQAYRQMQGTECQRRRALEGVQRQGPPFRLVLVLRMHLYLSLEARPALAAVQRKKVLLCMDSMRASSGDA